MHTTGLCMWEHVLFDLLGQYVENGVAKQGNACSYWLAAWSPHPPSIRSLRLTLSPCRWDGCSQGVQEAVQFSV